MSGFRPQVLDLRFQNSVACFQFLDFGFRNCDWAGETGNWELIGSWARGTARRWCGGAFRADISSQGFKKLNKTSLGNPVGYLVRGKTKVSIPRACWANSFQVSWMSVASKTNGTFSWISLGQRPHMSVHNPNQKSMATVLAPLVGVSRDLRKLESEIIDVTG